MIYMKWCKLLYSNSYINIPNYQKSVENDIFVLYLNNSGAIYSETA